MKRVLAAIVTILTMVLAGLAPASANTLTSSPLKGYFGFPHTYYLTDDSIFDGALGLTPTRKFDPSKPGLSYLSPGEKSTVYFRVGTLPAYQDDIDRLSKSLWDNDKMGTLIPMGPVLNHNIQSLKDIYRALEDHLPQLFNPVPEVKCASVDLPENSDGVVDLSSKTILEGTNLEALRSRAHSVPATLAPDRVALEFSAPKEESLCFASMSVPREVPTSDQAFVWNSQILSKKSITDIIQGKIGEVFNAKSQHDYRSHERDLWGWLINRDSDDTFQAQLPADGYQLFYVKSDNKKYSSDILGSSDGLSSDLPLMAGVIIATLAILASTVSTPR